MPRTAPAPAATTSASVVAGFIAFGVARGLPRELLLDAAGVAPADLADPDRPLPDSAMMGLWRLYLARFDDPAFPLAIAEIFRAGLLGIVGQIARHAADLRRALEQIVRYRRLVSPQLEIDLSDGPDGAALSLRHLGELHVLGAPIELMLALLHRPLAELVGAPVVLREVRFSHPARGPVAPYERFFAAPVRFAAGRDALLFAPGELARPLLSPSPELLRYLEAHAARMLEALPPVESDVVARVREVLARSLSEGSLDQARVARRLAMSSRTLQRRLEEAGTSFARVLDDMRRANALRLLGERGSIADVAFALGYADVPAFYRAFKRWTGRTPQQWRAVA